MAKYALDTHALVWHLAGNPRLSTTARNALNDPANEFIVSVVALAEACWMIEKRKTPIPSVQHLMNEINSDPRIRIVPLDQQALMRSLTLTAISEMHDRMIAATALEQSAVLITIDEDITKSGSTPVLW